MHKLFVYGTLRPKSGVTVKVPGKLYDLGWFPGCKLIPDGDAEFDCEILEVDDAGLRRADQYEGYLEDQPESSLFIRKPWKDGWIYEYNGGVDEERRVEGGDWVAYKPNTRTMVIV